MKLKPPFKINVPMVLTWLRIALIPVVLGVFYIPETWLAPHWVNVIACVTFVVAAVTDALDGFLARRYEGWATRMGAFLDPIADKLVVSAALVALVGLDRLDMAVAMIIIGREITVTGIREWMAKIGESGRVKVNWYGKTKTIAQMTAIPCLLWNDPIFGIDIALIGTGLIWLAAVLTIYSMYVYLQPQFPSLMKNVPAEQPNVKLPSSRQAQNLNISKPFERRQAGIRTHILKVRLTRFAERTFFFFYDSFHSCLRRLILWPLSETSRKRSPSAKTPADKIRTAIRARKRLSLKKRLYLLRLPKL